MGKAYYAKVEGTFGSQVKVNGHLFDNSKQFTDGEVVVYIEGGSFVPSTWNFYKSVRELELTEDSLNIKGGEVMYLVPRKGLVFKLEVCGVNTKSPVGTDVSEWLGVK